MQKVLFLFSRERVSSFPLGFLTIRPSAVFGTRRKTALRREGFAWVPDLESFLKLREVWVSPNLRFILRLRAMLMFELIEAVRGRLIGPKTWDRIVWIYGTQITVCDFSQTVLVTNGVIHVMDCIVICMRLEMAEIYGFTK